MLRADYIMVRHSPIIDWQSRVEEFDRIKPWKPCALTHEQWPPNYREVYAWRIETLRLLTDPTQLASAKAYYKTRPGKFIMHWMDTYNPRKAKDKWMPFVFFTRQEEFIKFLHEMRQTGESGLVEKCRDAGATWLACAYSMWSWIFVDDDAIGWGSRKQELVDKLGDASSIFEKMRLILRRLPVVFKPKKYSATFMRFVNNDNNSTVIGESGDNIGRGGRTAMYFKDEAAHFSRPELIEASLGDNTETQIDISSVNGLGNVFHRRADAAVEWKDGEEISSGTVRKFTIDWRDHPEKTQEWYDRRKAKYEREGMPHLFAQEVDRDYASSVTGAIIPYDWLTSCIDAHLKMDYEPPNLWCAGLDVADDGIDRNALTVRQGIIWRRTHQWGDRDPARTCNTALGYVRMHKGIEVHYDSIGIGAGVKGEYNRLHDIDLKRIKEGEKPLLTARFIAWNAGAGVVQPYARIIEDDEESLTNKDFFTNFKAQAWFALRTRVYKTWRFISEGVHCDAEDMISFDSKNPLLMQTLKELAQPVAVKSAGLKTMVDKQPDGMKSPDLADSGVMCFFPVPEHDDRAVSGTYV